MSVDLQPIKDAIIRVIENNDQGTLNEIARRVVERDPAAVRAEAEAATDARIAAREGYAEFVEQFPEIVADRFKMARAKELDSELAVKHPTVSPAVRMRAVGHQVMREADGEEDEITRDGMKFLAKHRHGIELDDDTVPEPDPFEQESSNVIARMVRDRRRAQGLEGSFGAAHELDESEED